MRSLDQEPDPSLVAPPLSFLLAGSLGGVGFCFLICTGADAGSVPDLGLIFPFVLRFLVYDDNELSVCIGSS